MQESLSESLKLVKKEISFRDDSENILVNVSYLRDLVKLVGQWEELFYLLKRDHELLENFQTNEWMVRAREMGIDV